MKRNWKLIRRNRAAELGFSLVEIIAVIAIIAIMTGLLVPAIKGMTSTAGRKGAVNILMNTLEQSRAAALESGADVYVMLLRREFPQPDVIRVVREPLPWKTSSKSGAKLETRLIPLTKWIKIPEGVLLSKPDKGANVFTPDVPDSFRALIDDYEREGSTLGPPGNDGQPIKLSQVDNKTLGIIWYSPSGSVRQPTGNNARIIVTEGVRGVGGSEAHLTNRKQSQGIGGGFEIITLARFTGRSQLDVTTVDE